MNYAEQVVHSSQGEGLSRRRLIPRGRSLSVRHERALECSRSTLASGAALLCSVPGMLFSGQAAAEWGLNLPPPKTETAATIMNLHNGIMIACFIIFILVFSVMFYSLFAHRKSRGVEPAKFNHSTKLEIVWTIIPTLILVGFAIPSTTALIDMEDTTESELTVKITGFQWRWQYEYLDSDVKFYSSLATSIDQIYEGKDKSETYLLEVDKPLVIPANTKVRFLITAHDVLHAWWVPAFGVKKDAIPGYINRAWTNVPNPGVYRGQCAELCGRDHGFMPIVVEVKSKDDFNGWLAAQSEQASTLTAQK